MCIRDRIKPWQKILSKNNKTIGTSNEENIEAWTLLSVKLKTILDKVGYIDGTRDEDRNLADYGKLNKRIV